jgi:cell division transport system ATP-binding protein
VELLKGICEKGSAILMITHNLNLLTEYPGKVYRFDNHHLENVTAEFANFSEQNVE